MNLRLLTFISALLLMGLAGAAEESHVARVDGPVAIDREVGGAFTGVKSMTSANVFITVGEPQAIMLKGNKEDLSRIIMTVENGVLKIQEKSLCRKGGRRFCDHGMRSREIEVHIKVPALKNVVLAGAGKIEINKVEGDSFSAFLSGSGDILLPSVRVNKLEIDLTGSGKINARGSAEEVSVELTGSGNVNVLDLVAQAGRVLLTGSGNVEVNATNKLTVKISGSGNVFYRGNPCLEKRVTGSGNVRKAW